MYTFQSLVRFASAILLFTNVIPGVFSQDEEIPGQVPDVTLEMFSVLQAEINALNTQLNGLQNQLQSLGSQIQDLASQPTAGGNELADLQALMNVSRKQEEDITKLFYSNGLWQQNFKVVNKTFEGLRKVVVFPSPVISLPVLPIAVRPVAPKKKSKPTTPVVPPANRNVTMKIQKTLSIFS